MRRSSADGRDRYCRIELARCGQLLASAGAALHYCVRSVLAGAAIVLLALCRAVVPTLLAAAGVILTAAGRALPH